MPTMPQSRKIKQSRQNRSGKSTLSLHVLPNQVHASAKSMGIWWKSAQESHRVVCGWEQPTAYRPSSWHASPHHRAVGANSCSAIASSTCPRKGWNWRIGRIVHLYRGEKNIVYVVTKTSFLSMRVWSITLASIAFLKERQIPTRLKLTMQSCDII